jgi:hypothetical protein
MSFELTWKAKSMVLNHYLNRLAVQLLAVLRLTRTQLPPLH